MFIPIRHFKIYMWDIVSTYKFPISQSTLVKSKSTKINVVFQFAEYFSNFDFFKILMLTNIGILFMFCCISENSWILWSIL